jgi:glycogen synthase
MMRIALISYEYPPDTAVGGIATYTAQAAAMLAVRGHHIEVFTASPNRSGTIEENGITVHRVMTTDRDRFRFAIGPIYRQRAQEVQFNVVEGPEYLAEAAEAARLNSGGAALVVRLHTPSHLMDELMRPPMGTLKRLRTELGAWRRGIRPPWWHDSLSDVERLHTESADVISAPSNAVADIAARDWKLHRDRIRVFPNVYQPSAPLLAIPTDTRTNTVTFLSRLEMRKGVIDLADAIPLILKQSPTTRFRLIGRPQRAPDGNGDMVDYLKSRLGPAAASVEFSPPIPHDRIAEVFAATDICVCPSIWENFPYACLEAMAAGRGVVASSAGGMAEMIRDDESGLLVPPRSPARIADAVVALLNDPARRMKMGEAARQRVATAFSFDAIAPQQEACYEQAIARRNARVKVSVHQPLVSVLMPVYNCAPYLTQAIDSILAQTFTDFEFLILDDGSTDGSAEIAQRFASKDSRIRFLRLPHQGYVPILCHWLEWCRGQFIARMDSDDIAMPQRFAEQVKHLQANPQCVVVGSRVTGIDPYGVKLFDSEHKLTHEEIDRELMRGVGWAIVHPVAMFRRAAALAVGGYRAQYAYAEDLDLYLRLAEVGQLANLPEVLLQYRQHTSSVNRTKQPAQARSVERAIGDAAARRGIELPAEWKFTPRPFLPRDRQLQSWAWKAMKTGNLDAARKHAVALWKTAPLSVESWRTLLCAMRGH